MSEALSFPERALLVRRGAARLCARLAWSPLHEVPLPSGRRADILALTPDQHFVCIEVKSGPRDFQTDAKWHEYRDYCDALFFAVDTDFPRAMLPEEAGLIVVDTDTAEILREPPRHALAPSRRRALLHRFAMLAAGRLALLEDPAGMAAMRAALKVE
jgi:hypothetical protein